MLTLALFLLLMFVWMPLPSLRPRAAALCCVMLAALPALAFAQRAPRPTTAASPKPAPSPTLPATQDPSRRVYQLSGLVIARAANEPVPFTLIKVLGARRVTTASADGFFSLPVLGNDTLLFQSIGFKPAKLSISEYLKTYDGDQQSQYLYVVEYLKEDSITLPKQVIFPYQTPEELRTAMLNLPMSDNDPDAIARASLTPERLAAYAETLPIDAEERRAAAAQQYYYNYRYNSGMATVGIFDPFAVARMVSYMKRKAKAEKVKTYDYWPEERAK